MNLLVLVVTSFRCVRLRTLTFNLADVLSLSSFQCHTFLGTVTYMSPERINGEPYSFPADIWALGLTLLECATGRYPYDASGGTIQLMIQVPPSALMDRCPWIMGCPLVSCLLPVDSCCPGCPPCYMPQPAMPLRLCLA